MSGENINRREFLGTVALVGGGITATALMPWPGGAQAATVVTPRVESMSDWTIDDMWGAYPRYAERITCGHQKAKLLAAADSLEALFFA